MAALVHVPWGHLIAPEERWQRCDRETIRNDEIHVWRADLPTDRMRREALGASLDERERERAARFRYNRDAQRYVAAHGILRSILARYAHVLPRSIVYEYSALGKPVLVLPDGSGTMEFNMAHSGDLVLIAIGGCHAVGVDVERIQEDVDLRELGAACLTQYETEILNAGSGEYQREYLFRLWTRKEAYGKASGAGLGISPKDCQVTPPFLSVTLPGEISEPAPASGHWAVWDLSPRAGYVGAVATRGERKALRFYDDGPGDSARTPPSGVSPVPADETAESWREYSYTIGHG